MVPGEGSTVAGDVFLVSCFLFLVSCFLFLGRVWAWQDHKSFSFFLRPAVLREEGHVRYGKDKG
jgi:hypothetical protein